MLKRSRLLTALALAFCLVLYSPVPARAATTSPFDLISSATQTGSAQGGAVSVTGVNELLVFFSCTASSAPTTLDVYLQSSPDSGLTWFDLPYELAMLTDGDATETAGTINGRDVLNGVTTCASPVKAVAKYRNFGSLVRVAWFITGTSFTFGVKAVGKI